MSIIERPMPPLNSDERTTLESWLDSYRATLARKHCADRHNGHADLLRERIDGSTGA